MDFSRFGILLEVHSPLDDIAGVQRRTLIKKSGSIKANFEHVDVDENFAKKKRKSMHQLGLLLAHCHVISMKFNKNKQTQNKVKI